MALKIWINGGLVERDDAKVGVYDHGFLYGDGVFEGIRVYSGRIFKNEAHLKRLFDSARAVRLEIPYSAEQLTAATYECVRVNGFTDCYIRMVVSRGEGCLGLSPLKCPKASVIIIADKIELYPPEMYEKGMSIITASVTRSHPNSLPPRVKSLNYLNNILAKIEANDAGVPEALMLNHQGNVSECTGDNIFIVRDGEVQTPTTADGILEGITRAAILSLCRELRVPCAEKTLQRFDVYGADECFLTGTAAEVVPVTCIDGRSIGSGRPGPVTLKLQDAFHKLVRQA
jgi:branched-chain amino acid aminotransferase